MPYHAVKMPVSGQKSPPKFKSAILGNVQHPQNVLREYMAAFKNKCQAAIVSYVDGWIRSNRSKNLPDWVRLSASYLAKELGYSQKTITTHLNKLVSIGVLIRDSKIKLFACDTAYSYKIDGVVLREIVKKSNPNYHFVEPESLPKLERTEEESALQAMTYDVFLKSDYWKAVRKHVLETRGKKCEDCGKSYKLQVHHVSYEHHGQEHLYLEDLKLLCARCHMAQHDLVGGAA